jgi:hypothetical protein
VPRFRARGQEERCRPAEEGQRQAKDERGPGRTLFILPAASVPSQRTTAGESRIRRLKTHPTPWPHPPEPSILRRQYNLEPLLEIFLPHFQLPSTWRSSERRPSQTPNPPSSRLPDFPLFPPRQPGKPLTSIHHILERLFLAPRDRDLVRKAPIGLLLERRGRVGPVVESASDVDLVRECGVCGSDCVDDDVDAEEEGFRGPKSVRWASLRQTI